jgi:hypothetical protein
VVGVGIEVDTSAGALGQARVALFLALAERTHGAARTGNATRAAVEQIGVEVLATVATLLFADFAALGAHAVDTGRGGPRSGGASLTATAAVIRVARGIDTRDATQQKAIGAVEHALVVRARSNGVGWPDALAATATAVGDVVERDALAVAGARVFRTTDRSAAASVASRIGFGRWHRRTDVVVASNVVVGSVIVTRTVVVRSAGIVVGSAVVYERAFAHANVCPTLVARRAPAARVAAQPFETAVGVRLAADGEQQTCERDDRSDSGTGRRQKRH